MTKIMLTFGIIALTSTAITPLTSLATTPYVQEILLINNYLTTSLVSNVGMMLPDGSTFQKTNNPQNSNLNPLPSNPGYTITDMVAAPNPGSKSTYQSNIDSDAVENNPSSFLLTLTPATGGWKCQIGYTHSSNSNLKDGLSAMKIVGNQNNGCSHISCDISDPSGFRVYRLSVHTTATGNFSSACSHYPS